MSGLGYQIYAFAASVTSMVFLVPSVYSWFKGRMPSAQMRELEALLSETDALLRSALEEGTIDYNYYEEHFHRSIWQAKLNADELRADVYNINGRWQELRAFSLGISSRIRRLIESLTLLRGDIATSSARGRQRLTSMGCTANPALAKYSQRDRVSSLALPVSPANTVQPSTIDGTEPTVGASAITAPIEHLPQAVPPATFTASIAPLTGPPDSEISGETSKSPSPTVQVLPPLCFKSHHKATMDACRAQRFVLQRCGKSATGSACLIGPSSGNKDSERRGFASRIRAFADLFLPPIPANSRAPALPTPPPPYVLVEKGAHLHTVTQWEENGHIVLQVKLPV
ncbi:hypothetical protein L226DRAFT_163098 [Lentinus tigrinus ALCF2SS1-7]|uniref:Uncharacterized protein n=1 Tax=Lentinus tigrinus ALCF2SS1-6 TaxID=1328759 RepID=A0A5C2S3P5_9APHY|nr:hypothetical protein L227DRAFT_613771 [Lentinus tigrinus ALCF2SS1-6]RPD72142.1 hypothetical protein L226DRAFT_163098 [Lentinus tigrinus ALCF2SS1-7]